MSLQFLSRVTAPLPCALNTCFLIEVMSNPTRLLLFLGLLLVVALSCLDLCSASFGTTLKLKPIAPLRMFDKQKRHDIDETPLLDSRVYQPYQRRDTVPIGGGIGTLGTYYTEIKVAGQPFRVIVVRF